MNELNPHDKIVADHEIISPAVIKHRVTIKRIRLHKGMKLYKLNWGTQEMTQAKLTEAVINTEDRILYHGKIRGHGSNKVKHVEMKLKGGDMIEYRYEVLPNHSYVAASSEWVALKKFGVKQHPDDKKTKTWRPPFKTA